MAFRKIALASFVAAGALAASTAPASARVVCNRYGDCWRTQETMVYPRNLGVRVYSDRYADAAYRERQWRRMHRHRHWHWRDEDHMHDRGAWRNGVWITF